MLHRMNELHGFDVESQDGHVGRLSRLYFDDRFWIARFIQVSSPAGERLVPIEALSSLDHMGQTATLSWGRDDLDARAPLLNEEHRRIPHLRSTTELEKYDIHAMDTQVGHVEDLVIDERDWQLRYIVVDTRKWLPGKSVLISPEWISSVAGSEKIVHVELNRDQICSAPPYDHLKPITREFEEALRGHYRRDPHLARTGS